MAWAPSKNKEVVATLVAGSCPVVAVEPSTYGVVTSDSDGSRAELALADVCLQETYFPRSVRNKALVMEKKGDTTLILATEVCHPRLSAAVSDRDLFL